MVRSIQEPVLSDKKCYLLLVKLYKNNTIYMQNVSIFNLTAQKPPVLAYWWLFYWSADSPMWIRKGNFNRCYAPLKLAFKNFNILSSFNYIQNYLSVFPEIHIFDFVFLLQKVKNVFKQLHNNVSVSCTILFPLI